MTWQMCCSWYQNHVESVGGCGRFAVTIGVKVVVEFPDLTISNERGMAICEDHVLTVSTVGWAIPCLNLEFGVVGRPVSQKWHTGLKGIDFGSFQVTDALGTGHTRMNRVGFCQKAREF